VGGQKALPVPREELVQDVVDAGLRHAEAQVVARHGLGGVGLVEDEVLVVRQQAQPLLSQRQVHEQQAVVHDEEVGVEDPPAGPLERAALEPLAVAAAAVPGLRADLSPYIRRGAEAEILEAPVVLAHGPAADPRQLVHLPRRGEERAPASTVCARRRGQR
jgi:hypothetical protein